MIYPFNFLYSFRIIGHITSFTAAKVNILRKFWGPMNKNMKSHTSWSPVSAVFQGYIGTSVHSPFSSLLPLQGLILVYRCRFLKATKPLAISPNAVSCLWAGSALRSNNLEHIQHLAAPILFTKMRAGSILIWIASFTLPETQPLLLVNYSPH